MSRNCQSFRWYCPGDIARVPFSFLLCRPCTSTHSWRDYVTAYTPPRRYDTTYGSSHTLPVRTDATYATVWEMWETLWYYPLSLKRDAMAWRVAEVIAIHFWRFFAQKRTSRKAQTLDLLKQLWYLYNWYMDWIRLLQPSKNEKGNYDTVMYWFRRTGQQKETRHETVDYQLYQMWPLVACQNSDAWMPLRLGSCKNWRVNKKEQDLPRSEANVQVYIIISAKSPGPQRRSVSTLDYVTGQLENSQNLGGFALASCCVGVQIYASMRIAVADPVIRRRDSAGLSWFAGTGSHGHCCISCIRLGTIRSQYNTIPYKSPGCRESLHNATREKSTGPRQILDTTATPAPICIWSKHTVRLQKSWW